MNQGKGVKKKKRVCPLISFSVFVGSPVRCNVPGCVSVFSFWGVLVSLHSTPLHTLQKVGLSLEVEEKPSQVWQLLPSFFPSFLPLLLPCASRERKKIKWEGVGTQKRRFPGGWLAGCALLFHLYPKACSLHLLTTTTITHPSVSGQNRLSAHPTKNTSRSQPSSIQARANHSVRL